MKNIHFMLALLFICGLMQSTPVAAGPKNVELDKCINNPSIPIKTCVQSQTSKITIDSCYAVEKKVYSNTAKERLKEYCFFNVSEFPSLKSCITAAARFYSAELHDEGLFQCYIQFSEKMSNRTCIEISKKMIFQNKRNYLANQCQNR